MTSKDDLCLLRIKKKRKPSSLLLEIRRPCRAEVQWLFFAISMFESAVGFAVAVFVVGFLVAENFKVLF